MSFLKFTGHLALNCCLQTIASIGILRSVVMGSMYINSSILPDAKYWLILIVAIACLLATFNLSYKIFDKIF